VDRLDRNGHEEAHPDVRLDLVNSRTFEGGLQLLEYAPTVLEGPPGTVV